MINEIELLFAYLNFRFCFKPGFLTSGLQQGYAGYRYSWLQLG